MANKKETYVEDITPKSKDFSQWYTDVVRKAELADYSMVKGCMIIRPYGYAIWELMQQALDRRIKATGHLNAYFPLFIPESLLKKEAEHVEGFAPEVAWVTHGGKEQLEERLAIRPTSEAIICSMYAKWVRSWRDLPLLINQWANVVRWEKVTRPFLRTTEFLWQEGHTVHATAEEAEEETLKMLDVYRDFVETELAIPLISGLKTDRERFAGALRTYSIEAMMWDGKALQAGTSHNLGQNFSKAFEIRFEDQNQKMQYAWTTSWGSTTRLIGALIMAHGDDSGLIIPPRVAPYQAVIVPIAAGNWQETVLPHAQKLHQNLIATGFRIRLDDRDAYTPGWKYSDWEMRGVPVRIEIGPKDIAKNQVVMVRRDNRQKSFIPLAEAAVQLQSMLESLQKELFDRAKAHRDSRIFEIDSYPEFLKLMEENRGWAYSCWCGAESCETKVKEDTSATVRVIPSDQPAGKKDCAVCGSAGKFYVYFAKSY
ncbi:MAG TPA: proline--tRNA ligase [Acidobacteriota bacterium]